MTKEELVAALEKDRARREEWRKRLRARNEMIAIMLVSDRISRLAANERLRRELGLPPRTYAN